MHHKIFTRKHALSAHEMEQSCVDSCAVSYERLHAETAPMRHRAPVTSASLFECFKFSFSKNVGMYNKRFTKCLVYAQSSEKCQQRNLALLFSKGFTHKNLAAAPD